MQVMILGAVQADDEGNRAFAKFHGADGVPWPVPYKNSVPATCAGCEGAVWLGPEQDRTRKQAVEAGTPPLVILCLLCCCLTGAADDANVISLTRKGPGE
jgi:hypothetical protein